MVLISAADREMTDFEMKAIGDTVQGLPVFRDFDATTLPAIASDCVGMLQNEDGLDAVLDHLAADLPAKLRETAYALACEVAAANGSVSQEVMRLLEILRHHLNIDRLIAAAIERGVRARYAHL
ncbi:MAG: hypothetical protein CMO30_12845 [Tistrella sp.]|uniref:Co-chaperone DjlA N-terminal domain-containing protein n=2 Tax=Tistrella mobilis TaxID=171437 RepID=I3TP95_TISMK|nr:MULTISPECIES: tellurite resistance TerB family protein [Tistrella]AFK54583.1 hypothetical protein TMO_2745 [Tistrella mobilis KA081020-065]MAD35607.1 hypothetical protein [Tistrella sp.]MAM75389.1 hypothetical protein [Tistrella sp.]MBA76154.1 hypothetical protein [Tistrella sp.]